MRPRLLIISTIVLVVPTTLPACGSDGDRPMGGMSATAGSAGAAGLNAADVEFSQGMIAHHQQAIEMAEIALDPTIGAGAAVIDLATRIRDAQDPEVDMMTGWLTSGGHSMMMDESGGHSMSSMDGMMSVEQMDEMAASTGASFDEMWLTMMIAHHEGAISQAESVKAKGADSAVLALADQIITAQRAEIAEMQALLDS